MKTFQKTMLSLLLTLCLLTVPFSSALAQTTPLDLMPTTDAGYTIVSGDGTVSIADGTMTIVNNGDGDLRITLDNTAAFDLTALHSLHMAFNAEMPFKMAYHIVSNADSTSGWLNTSTNYVDLFEIDTAADRAAAGEYNVTMNMNDSIATITDKSAVYFEQFIILLTGKGTFTLNTVEVTDGTSGGSAEDTTTTGNDSATTTSADSDATTQAPATTTTVKKPAGNSEDSAKTGDESNAIVFATVAIAAAGAVTLSVVSKKASAR